MSADYRRVRFLAFLHPWEDVKNTGYQLAQSLYALGSGGWIGVGLGASRQKWQYVPNAHTDFIFSILGEELGLLGEIVVLVAFGALIFAGIRIAANTQGRVRPAARGGHRRRGSACRRSSTSGRSPACSRSPGCRSRSCRTAGSSLVVSLAAVGVLVSIARAAARAPPAGPPPRTARRRCVSARSRHPSPSARPTEAGRDEGARRGGRHRRPRVPGARARARARVGGARGALRGHVGGAGGAARPRGGIRVRDRRGQAARACVLAPSARRLRSPPFAR